MGTGVGFRAWSVIHHVGHFISCLWRHEKKRGPVYRQKKSRALTPEQRRRLEYLCDKLFERQDLVNSGRLQLLGLGKVKQRFGKHWYGIQNAIYDLCEEVIARHVEPGDIFIRYQEETYILLFPSCSPAQSERKTYAIAEEIKRRLFEEDIDEIEVKSTVVGVRGSAIDRRRGFPKSLHDAVVAGLHKKEVKKRPSSRSPNRDVYVPPDLSKYRKIEVDAFSESLRKIMPLDMLGEELERIPFRAIHYIPVWEQYNSRLVAYICMARDEDAADPIKGHLGYYKNRTPHDIGFMDLSILARVIHWMKEHEYYSAMSFGLICPVHYDTLVRMDTKQRYRALCQKIKPFMRSKIVFMVLDTPCQAPAISLSEAISPLKTYSRKISAQLSCREKIIDFKALHMAGFDSVGMIAPDIPIHDHARLMHIAAEVKDFVARANRNFFKSTFVIGADHPGLALEAFACGAYYVAGQAIHGPVRTPLDTLNFQHYPFFRLWQGEAV